MQIEHVDIVGAHEAERIVETRDHAFRRPPFVVAVNGALGRDHHLVARNRFQRPADHTLGAIRRRGIDEIDAELDRIEHEPRGLILGLAGFQPHPRKAASAEPGNADAQAGAAEGGVVHGRCFLVLFFFEERFQWFDIRTKQEHNAKYCPTDALAMLVHSVGDSKCPLV